MTRENTVDIIIPTYNNVVQLQQCVSSMLCTKSMWPFHVIIVNNGHRDCEVNLPSNEGIEIVEPKEGNVGWTGGLIEGLKMSKSDLVMFANDDIFIPSSSYQWLHSMVRILLNNRSLAAVGPSTNCAMGLQNIWNHSHSLVERTTFLIGFCMLLKRDALDKVGGVDPSFNNGDDIDLSIRFRDYKYGLAVDRSTFIYHHGFQTGVRVHGDHTKKNGWNSPEMTRRTNDALIRKHGFLKWWHTMVKVSESEVINSVELEKSNGN